MQYSNGPKTEQLTLEVTLKQAGEHSPYAGLFLLAWDEFAEFQTRPRDSYAAAVYAAGLQVARWEAVMLSGSTPVGIAVFALDEDIHVGVCLSIMHQYVLPAYRNRGVSLRFMRAMYRCAKNLAVPCVAYTHRVRPGVYTTTYRRVRHE